MRAETATFAPSASNRPAVAAPIPVDAPTTQTRSPLKEEMGGFSGWNRGIRNAS